MRLPLLFATSIFFAPSAWSAESGTYRPGQSYHSTYASSPGQCEQECLGDAQCKVWNFVRVQTSPTGAICEFKGRISQPIASPISISGENPSAFDSVKIISAGHRTVRVGQPAISAHSQISSQARQMPNHFRRNQTVRVGAVPIPRVTQPARAIQTQAIRNNSMVRPSPAPLQKQIRGGHAASINGQLSDLPAPHTQPATPQQHVRDQSIAFRHNLGTAEYRPTKATQPVFRPHLDTQNQMPPMATPQVAEMPVSAPTPQFTRASNIPQQAVQPKVDSSLAGAPEPVLPTRNALFGSLFDDVKTPRSLQRSDISLGHDAPIPTVTSVPVGEVVESPLY